MKSEEKEQTVNYWNNFIVYVITSKNDRNMYSKNFVEDVSKQLQYIYWMCLFI